MMISTVERERIAALEGFEVLDTAPEPLFDGLTELAAMTFGTPIALISLVDAERQWFKACVGLDVDHTSREISFCQCAIRDDRVFVVLDALEDARFKLNPLVLGAPFIRFYAGAPLIAPQGHRLGTLCIIDTAPRAAFSLAETQRLEALAASVMQALLLRLSARQRDRIDAVAQERRAMLRQAEEMAGVGTWSVDAATGQTTWSEEVYRIHALDPSVASPNLMEALARYHPDDAQNMALQVRRALTLGEGYEAHARIVRPDGEERHVIARADCRRGPGGEITGLFGTFQDVTALKLADAALRSNETRLRHLLENASDMIVRNDPNGLALEVSPACRQYGYEPHEIVAMSPAELIHPDDIGVLMAARDDNFSGRDPDRTLVREYRMRTKDGAWRWVQGNPTVLRNADGSVREVISVFRDVTARKEAEQALLESEARYRLLAQNARDVIACYGPDARFTYVSPSIAAVLGYEPEELIGRTPMQFMHPDDIKPTQRLLASFVRQGPSAAPMRYEYRAFRKDGSLVWLEANPRAIFEPDSGDLLEFQDVVRDATRRKRLEAELAAACDAAISATAVKSEFMANMSHEIRTPLTAILGFTNLLMERPDLPDAAKTQVRRVKGAGAALLAIVNDVLDFSQLEAGQMPITPRPVEIAELAEDALAMFALQAEEKSLQLTFEQDPAVPPSVSVDPDRVRQILLNLVGNAIKFTEAGAVRLRMTYDAEARQLGFEVEDTGSGMDELQQASLFRRFSQVDASSTRRHGGTGLGLAICKALAEAMGGRIGVRSTPGEGSTFHVRLDAPPVSATTSQAATASAPPLDGVRVLLADDSESNREIARLLLARTGAEVTEALDGTEAVALAGEIPFDAILLDLRMPIMDGDAAMAAIRSVEGPNRDVPIFAFTAGGAGRAPAGFDGVIAKPIRAADLISTLAAATAWRPLQVPTKDADAVRA